MDDLVAEIARLRAEKAELEQRVADIENWITNVLTALERQTEEGRRAIGRLDRAAEFCRGLDARLEQIESNIVVAGGALITTASSGGLQ